MPAFGVTGLNDAIPPGFPGETPDFDLLVTIPRLK
jgi:hypothetical protein